MVYLFIVLLVMAVLQAALVALEVILDYRLEVKEMDQYIKEVSKNVKNWSEKSGVRKRW